MVEFVIYSMFTIIVFYLIHVSKDSLNSKIGHNIQYYKAVSTENDLVIDSLVLIENRDDYWYIENANKSYFLGKCSFYLELKNYE